MGKKHNQDRVDGNTAPKKDDLLTVRIENLGADGEGIAHHNGYTLFVKDAVTLDLAEVKVIKAKKNYGYARLMDLKEKSEYRTEPVCPIARQCGGCTLQHVDYQYQLQFKQQKVKDCLERIGGFDLSKIEYEDIIGMDNLYNYRNKAQFPVGKDKNGNIVMGFYAGHSHNIINNKKCYLQDEINEDILMAVEKFMLENNIEPYNETTRKGVVRHIITRIGGKTKEISITIVINSNSMKKELQDKLVEALKEIPKVECICLNINTQDTNVIMGEKMIQLYGKPYITDYIGDVKYQISPQSFYQVNPEQTEKLYNLALEYANLTGDEVVWDMYCGIGTISLFLAKKAKKVYGVEIVEQAIINAKENAKINNIDNAEFYAGAAEVVVPELYEKMNGAKADVVVVDPPRKGCDKKLLETLVLMEPKRIVYVSCDPATMARDAKWLCENGYELVRARAVDQFGHTGHVETVVLIQRTNG